MYMLVGVLVEVVGVVSNVEKEAVWSMLRAQLLRNWQVGMQRTKFSSFRVRWVISRKLLSQHTGTTTDRICVPSALFSTVPLHV